MLALEDTLVLPAGVQFDRDAVVDALRGGRYPVNATASFVLEREGRPLGEVATELAGTYGLAPERARHDVLSFALALNHRLLANIRVGGGVAHRLVALLGLAVRLAPAGRLPTPLARREPLDTSSVHRAVVTTTLALRRRMLVLWLVGAMLAIQLAFLAGAAPGVAAVALPSALALGVALHEAGHAAALVGVAAALVVSGPRTFVVHASVGPSRRRRVAASGPALPAAAGVVLVCAGAFLALPAAALGGCVLAGHATCLTVLTGDGRTACGL